MSNAVTILRKYSILIHRWMGVGFCVLFVVWFISGIVMMYWYYPSVTAAKRLGRSASLDASRIQTTPEEAYARLELGGSPDRVRIAMLDGRPVYRFHYGSEQLAAYADDGEVLAEIRPEQALRIASAWTGQPATAATFRGLLTEVDQWTVNPAVRPYGPYLKYSWPNGEEVYVSQVSGEVVQHTTRGDRFWAYLGAIPHWLYFTPLRKDQQLWHDVVVWSSGIGTVMTIFGIVVGIWLYSPSRKRFRFPDTHSGSSVARRLWRAIVSPEGRSSIPYAGQKRWHTMLGLLFGLFACTWAFSGMLSMSPFAWLRGRPAVDLSDALRGAEWRPESFSAEHPREALARLGSELHVKELELAFVAGEPVYFAREAPDRALTIPLQGSPRVQLDEARLVEVIRKAAAPHSLAEVRVVRQYESYYIDRDYALPLPVLFVRLNDDEGSMYYVDLRTGRVVQSYGAGGRWNRWLYHGLHSFDLPFLYRHRPAWDIAVLFLMLGGTGLCVTSVIIGWRRLRRKVAMRSARSIYTSSSRGEKELSSPPMQAGR
jgi:hypothetical protein